MAKNTNKTEKKTVAVKKWTIQITEYDDGSSMLERQNEGFNVYELLGLAAKAQIEILQQMGGFIKPTVTKRVVVKK